MAKHSMLMGTARGKLGNMVLSRVDGVQITRAYNPNVANPKTVGQATQRAIFATISYMAAILSTIVDNSFDGYKNGRKSRQAFVKKNLDLVRSKYLAGERVYLLPKGEKLASPQQLIISSGKLSPFPLVNGQVGTTLCTYVSLSGHTAEDDTVVIDLSELKILCPDIKAGSQLTFVSVAGDGDRYNMKLRKARIVLGSWIDDDTPIFNLSQSGIFASAIDTSKTEGFNVGTNGDIDFDYEGCILGKVSDGDNGYYLAFRDNDEEFGWASGIIVSNYNADKGEWEHSECKLTVADQIDWFNTDADVVPSFMENANRITSNNAYTEQSDDSNYPPYNSSLNAAFQAIIASPGYTQKSLNLEANNTYGPIPEGNLVQMFLTPANGATIDTSSLRVLAGEAAVTDVRATRIADGSVFIAFNLQNGSTQSVTYNVTFNGNLNPAYDDTERQYGFRVAISKVQA